MEGEKEKGWRGRRRRGGGGTGEGLEKLTPFLNRGGEKDGRLDRQGVDRLCFPGKANGVVIILELGFGVRF